MKRHCHSIVLLCHEIVTEMKSSIITLLLLSAFSIANAQSEDQKHIKDLCGCFSVNFQYAETFSPYPDYQYHDREEMNAVELALMIEETDRKIVIQHLLVINDSFIIKHWREEWTYEQQEVFDYVGDFAWKKRTLTLVETKGQWTQTVWEVSDQPRYRGNSRWIQNDGKVYWESTADAPLPRREYKKRDDYNIMRRHNRLVMTKDGYIHEQDNEKIVRKDGVDDILVQEKGLNSYYRMADSECEAAKKWWRKNEAFWAVVRTEWNNILEESNSIRLHVKVDDKMMHEHLDPLWRKWAAGDVPSSEIEEKIKDLIAKFYVSAS